MSVWWPICHLWPSQFGSPGAHHIDELFGYSEDSCSSLWCPDFDISVYVLFVLFRHFLHGLTFGLLSSSRPKTFLQEQGILVRQSKKLEVFLYCWIKTSHVSTTVCLTFLIPTPPRLRTSSGLECWIRWAALPAADLLQDPSLPFTDWEQNLACVCVSGSSPVWLCGCGCRSVRDGDAPCTGCLGTWSSSLCSFGCLLF